VSLHVVRVRADVTSESISKLIIPIVSGAAEAEREHAHERATDLKPVQKQRALSGGKCRTDTQLVLRVRWSRSLSSNKLFGRCQLGAEGMSL
jgi:hypothetical protein